MNESQPLWSGTPPGYQIAEDAPFCPTITPYLVANNQYDNPAVIVFPGGGYQTRADHEKEPIALWLNSIGVSAFVLEYRVAPYRHPVPLMDGQRAVRLARFRAAEYRIDPTKIGILGFSAGGHLASTVGTHFDEGDSADSDPIQRIGSRPDALILCYAVISFGEWGHQGSKMNLLGNEPSPDLVESLSNELQVTDQTPPTFLWHTVEDAGVPVENSLLFAGALSRCGVPFALHVYPKGPHGIGLATETPYASEWTVSCERWLREMDFIS